MTKLWTWIKGHVTLVIALAVILTLAMLSFRACDIYDNASLLKGEITQLKATAKLVAAKSDKIISENKKAIAAKDVEISLLTTKIGDANKIIGGLQVSYGDLEKQYAAASTCPEHLTIALAQVGNLKSQIVEKDKIIASQSNVILGWQTKYDLAIGIGGAWQAKFTSESQLRLKCEELNSSLQKALGICRITGTIKSGLVVAAIAYIGARAIGVLK
jgi:hypothetical protein